MLNEKLKKIRLLLLDVDGVLTDGGIIYDNNGVETKKFNSKDGLGLRLLMDNGINVGIVTGRSSGALIHRCNNLGIELVFDGVKDKASVLDDILEKTKTSPEEIAFIGDDLPDIPLFNLIGVPIAVADAHEAVCERALMVTTKKGGKGGVREACDSILKAKGLWTEIIERFK